MSLLLHFLATLLQSVQIPAPTGLVNDFANVISAAQEERIARIAEDVRTKSRGEIAVVTLPNIGDRDVAEIALRIGREWRVGKIGDPGDATRNAGVVVLIVPKETSSDGRGRCRIETGSGSEGFITDATAGDICRAATPLFAARDYGGGIEQVTFAVAQRFAGEFGFAVDTAFVPAAAVARSPRDEPFPIGSIIFMLVLIMLISRMSRRGRRGRRGHGWLPVPIILPPTRGWGGGGFSGGFGGGGGFGGFGGGGGFSGGGGGSSW